MRIYPPIWGLIRVAVADDVIGGKEIRPGDRVTLFAYGAHHNPKFWEEPEEFRPERWMGGAAKKQVKYSYIPVWRGQALVHRRRDEPGRKHAGAVDAAAPLPARVRGEDPAGINATVTLTPKGGLPFRIRELS